MPAPFQRLSLEEFSNLLARFPFKRQINAVHMHHTWRPNHAQDLGLKSLEGMWQYHIQVNGWSDIAQHITISSNGDIWTGRSWNQPPASAAGHNGNREIGPFMFEVIGDFDEGRDRFEGSQREVVLEVIARVQLRFNLPVESLKFHHQMSRKSCPGTSIKYDEVLNALREVYSRLQDASHSRNLSDRPFPLEALAFPRRIEEVIEMMNQELPERDDPSDAEPDLQSARESDFTILTGMENPTVAAPGQADQRNGKQMEFPSGILSELRPHVINLVQGEFSSNGIFTTSPADVDAIFEDYLPRRLAEAKASGRKLRLVFYAHGGLTPEKNALRAAYEHLSWWRANHVYPIYFIWETGFLETIGQLLWIAGQQFLGKEAIKHGMERDIWDATSDPVIEELVRNLGCVQIWSGMKRSAERAFQPDGGGFYLAQKLKEFCDRHAAEREYIELHGIGYSAGAIFQSHFVSAARQLGVRSFKTMHFLAPAIRIDTFENLLLHAALIGQGKGIEHLTIFTMKKDWELADNCVVYRKSLLYLIYSALEPQRKTPILGLEESLRANPNTRSLFGLSGKASATGDVVWSKSLLTTGPNASTCTEHGKFTANRPTMNSVLLRILNATDNSAIAVDFPEEATRELEVVDFERLIGELEPTFVTASANGAKPAEGISNAFGSSVSSSSIATGTTITPLHNGQRGRRSALCVGIDAYPPPAELFGCVADANLWATLFNQLGFSTTQLLNQQATRSAILDTLGHLVRSSQHGDVIAFQFSGHGIQLPDMSRDETEGDSPYQDEAICPYDYASGAFVIDDDIAEIFNTIPAGVNVTCFIDCCHSGTISRFAVGTPPPSQTSTQKQRVRFIQPTAQMIEAHRRFRQQTGRSRTLSSGGIELMKEVMFSACLSIEVAYENNGQGDFTRYATQIFQQGIQGLSHEEFERRVIAAFGSTPRQHPRLYCNAMLRSGLLLQSLAQSSSSRTIAALDNDTAALAQGFRMIADLLEKRK